MYPIYGKDWKSFAEALQTKSDTQIRNYYQNNERALGLSGILVTGPVVEEVLPPPSYTVASDGQIRYGNTAPYHFPSIRPIFEQVEKTEGETQEGDS